MYISEWAINFVKHDGMQAMFHKLTRTVDQNQEFDVKISYKNQYLFSILLSLIMPWLGRIDGAQYG